MVSRIEYSILTNYAALHTIEKGNHPIYIPWNIPESQSLTDHLYSKRISRITYRSQPPAPFSDHEIQLALMAPRRPETSGCTLCGDKCSGGRCANWRERRAAWVESWDGRAPPDDDAQLADWWARAKARHKLLVAAAAPPGTSASKRAAAADGTPNGGGQRKDAPLSATRAARRELELPPALSDDSSGAAAILLDPSEELIGKAEAIALVDAAEAAEAAEALMAAEAAEAAEAAAR